MGWNMQEYNSINRIEQNRTKYNGIDWSGIKNKVIKILDTFSKGRFIFNLGHGMLPEAKVEKVEELINIVKSYDR